MALTVPDPLNVNKIQTNQIVTNELESRTINVESVTGRGTGAIIRASKIYLGNFLLEAKDDGIYVTTPDGTDTKIELIDLSFTPIPPAVDLLPVSQRENVGLEKPVGGGPDKEGAGLGTGNALGGGGAVGSTATTPGVPYEAPSAGKITPGGDGEGYKAITDAAKAKLPPSMNNPEFLGCLDDLAKSKNVPADSLLTVMQIESGFTSTDAPGKGASAVNKYSRASGLNQITEKTAGRLGYTLPQIQGMTASEQMCGPVTKYFNMQTLPEKPSTADLYLANFYPAAVGKSDDYIIGNSPSENLTPEKVAAANEIFKGPDGLVSVGSVKNWIKTKYPAAE
jgi:hypothetical protein